LMLNSSKDWSKYCQGEIPGLPRLPADMSMRPDRTYKNRGWVGWGDWLGFGPPITQNKDSKTRREYRPFQEARAFVQSLELGGQKEWYRYCRGGMPNKGVRPDDIPVRPNVVYRDAGWNGLGDWLGTGRQAPRGKWRPFEEARAFVHGLGLKSTYDWVKYTKGGFPELPTRPSDIPADPPGLPLYRASGWAGFPDWLGFTPKRRLKGFKSYEEARAFVHTLGLGSYSEWEAYCRGQYSHKGTRPSDIPANPDAYYRDKGWKDYKDWLGL
jgi:hypothetical protein